MEIEFRRGESEMKCRITPTLSGADGKYRIGMWVRDSTAGIGTVTFVVPETLAFGGLGHGICDTSSGELVPLLRGSVSDVEINSVERGVSGDPGELHGIFVSGKRGSVIANTENGYSECILPFPTRSRKKSELPSEKGAKSTTEMQSYIAPSEIRRRNIRFPYRISDQRIPHRRISR